MISKIFSFINKISVRGSSFLMNKWYNHISKLDPKGEITFLNYGYQNGKKLKLKKIDEKYRYCIQLYHKVASFVKIKDKKVLDVGCGMGGGAFYISRYLKPRLIVGMDKANSEIKFNKKHYFQKNLKFEYGDAMNSPFEDESFDVVINVESSHSYINFDKFLKEVKRVLKSKEYFLFADFRKQEVIKQLFVSIKKSGFKIIKKEDITKNVVKALDMDNERRVKLIKKFLPTFLHEAGEQFAGVKFSELYNSFRNGKRRYFYFVLQKI